MLSESCAAPSVPLVGDASPTVGVPTLLGSSSSITKALSNSEGSGPLGSLDTSTFLLLDPLAAGDSFREEADLPAVEADLAMGVPEAFARACSSAMRESTAALMRFEIQ